MKIYIHNVLLSTIMIATCSVAGAVEVYEQDDQQGVPEYSDKASPGAKEIEVKPNVIEVEPVKPADLPPPPDLSKSTKVPDDNELPEVTHGRTVVDYGEENFKELKRDQRQRRDAR